MAQIMITRRFLFFGSHSTYFTDLDCLSVPFVEILTAYCQVSVLCCVIYVLGRFREHFYQYFFTIVPFFEEVLLTFSLTKDDVLCRC